MQADHTIDDEQCLGKGDLICSILDKAGATLRQVNIKARLDVGTMQLRIAGIPLMVIPGPRDQTDQLWLDFDPRVDPDPVTGQMYEHFCYADDAGKQFDLDPVTLVATNDEIRAAALLEVVDQIIAGSAPQG